MKIGNTDAIDETSTLLATPDSAIPPAKLPVIQRAVMAACDRRDGVADGLIENPLACTSGRARLQGS